MINKLFKTIHNRYLLVFKFLFFLRYLFVIFLVSFALFLIIPKYFDYEKKENIIKNYLLENYNLKINKHSEINYYILPKPKIEIKNVETKSKQISSTLFIDRLILYPKIMSIYNYNEFQINKLIAKKNKIKLEFSELDIFIKNILNKKKNFFLKDLDIDLNEKKNLLISLKDINFSNFGINRNKFFGKIFNKNFEVKIEDDLSFISIRVPDIDFLNEIEFKDLKKDLFQGNTKVKVLNTNLKFDFLYSVDKFEILNSYFRSKNLSFSAKSIITIDPYFDSDSIFIVEDINFDLINQLDLKKLIGSKNIIEKINSKNEVSYKSKKFSKSMIDKFNLKLDLAYGQLNYQKEFYIEENLFKCNGSINLFEELPLLFFDCSLFSQNKKDFLKVFSIKYKTKDSDESFKLNVKGNISLMNNKINLKSLVLNNYRASREDLKYFKDKFESIILDEGYLDIFDLKKIKNFILEIS